MAKLCASVQQARVPALDFETQLMLPDLRR